MLLQSESMAVCVWPLADSLFATKFLSLVPQWEEHSPRGWPTCAPSPLGASVSQSVEWECPLSQRVAEWLTESIQVIAWTGASLMVQAVKNLPAMQET